MSEDACRRLRIHGLVQGVGFRFSMQIEARRLALSGWVRNRRDGTVEAVVCGPTGAVEALVAWSHRGPPGSRVESVVVTAEEGRFEGFEQRPTQ